MGGVSAPLEKSTFWLFLGQQLSRHTPSVLATASRLPPPSLQLNTCIPILGEHACLLVGEKTNTSPGGWVSGGFPPAQSSSHVSISTYPNQHPKTCRPASLTHQRHQDTDTPKPQPVATATNPMQVSCWGVWHTRQIELYG